MFDVMVKRLHEYKRQTLKLLHIVTLYQRISGRTRTSTSCRGCSIFGAKAAPGLPDGQGDHRADQRGRPGASTPTRWSRAG